MVFDETDLFKQADVAQVMNSYKAARDVKRIEYENQKYMLQFVDALSDSLTNIMNNKPADKMTKLLEGKEIASHMKANETLNKIYEQALKIGQITNAALSIRLRLPGYGQRNKSGFSSAADRF